MATLSTYRALVQNEVGDLSARAQNVIDRAVQDVYQEILSFTAKYLINSTEEDITASTSNRYVTPTNTYSEFQNVLYHNATDTNFYKLKPITEDEYYARHVNSATSDPTCYYLKGNLIYFDVVPSTAGTVKVAGIKVQAELTGAEVSLIPDRFTGVLVTGAIARFKAYEGTPDASEYQKMYKGSFWGQGRISGLLDEMIRELSVKRRIIRPKFFGR